MGRPKAAVFPREADACETAVVELLLKFAGTQPRCLFAAVRIRAGWPGRCAACSPPARPWPVPRTRRPIRSCGRRRRRLGHQADSRSLGDRIDAQVVILWRAEHRAVERDPTQVQMKVVFPRHADAAVQLDAVLQHAGGVFAHIRFRDADRHFGIGGAARHRRDSRVGGRLARLEPDLQIGVFVLEHLIRPDRAAERMPVEAPLDGELQHGVEDADDLGALKYLQRSGSVGRSAPRVCSAVPTAADASISTPSKCTRA